jgi:hypothetical protein
MALLLAKPLRTVPAMSNNYRILHTYLNILYFFLGIIVAR